MSRGLTWDVGAWPSSVQNILRYRTGRSFPIKEKSSTNWSGSHVPIKNSNNSPPTALRLGSEDSQLSGAYALQVWWRSCLVRRGITAAVKCYVRKSRFFFNKQPTEMIHHYRRHCSRVSVRWRENLFCFLISGTIIVRLRVWKTKFGRVVRNDNSAKKLTTDLFRKNAYFVHQGRSNLKLPNKIRKNDQMYWYLKRGK